MSIVMRVFVEYVDLFLFRRFLLLPLIRFFPWFSICVPNLFVDPCRIVDVALWTVVFLLFQPTQDTQLLPFCAPISTKSTV